MNAHLHLHLPRVSGVEVQDTVYLSVSDSHHPPVYILLLVTVSSSRFDDDYFVVVVVVIDFAELMKLNYNP